VQQAYLSDGGHVENMGVYALLAERCAVIVAVDCGADPDYVFGDLENLIRRARIDLDTEIVVLERSAERAATADELPLAAFGSLDDLKSPQHEARIAIATVRYPSGPPGVMLIVKPSTWSSMPADLANYQQRHPQFPQQPTTDQFFDEEQWESYYKLGAELGRALAAVLPPDLYALLRNFAEPPMARGLKDDKPAQVAPSRLAARILAKPVASTVQLGALITAGLAAWQAIDSLGARREQQRKEEQAALKELTDLWGKLPALAPALRPASSASTPPVASAPAAGGQPADAAAAVNALAAAMARSADVLCRSDGRRDNWFWTSKAAQRINVDARLACGRLLAPVAPACQALLSMPSCLSFGEDETGRFCEPRYWAFDFSRSGSEASCLTRAAADRLTDAAVPAAAPGPPTAAPAPSPGNGAPSAPPSAASAATSAASQAAAAQAEQPPLPTALQERQAAEGADKPCAGITVYVQVFGGEWRDDARALREPWRKLGASVPPIEDVLATSRARSRPAPVPVDQPEMRLAPAPTETAKACADRLEKGLALRYGEVLRLAIPQRLSPRPAVVEVWLPPRAPNLPP
jgi:hypothetical protein